MRSRQVRLTSDMSLPRLSTIEIISYATVLLGMWAVLNLKLLGALLPGPARISTGAYDFRR